MKSWLWMLVAVLACAGLSAGEPEDRPDAERKEGDNRPRRSFQIPREAMHFARGLGINPENMSSQMLVSTSRTSGLEVDAKSEPKLNSLPLGLERSLILRVPVGGIESFPTASDECLKLEALFKLTEEQGKALQGLRDEFSAERKKLEEELLLQHLAIAEKARQLRLKFEQRANDVLTGPDKDAKEKIDVATKESLAKHQTLLEEFQKQNAAEAAKGAEERNDWGKRQAQMNEIRTKADALVAEAKAKILALLPADAREKLSAIFKKEQDEREQWREQMRNFGFGRRGQGGENRGPAENKEGVRQPPRPPEQVQPRGEF